MYNVYIEEWVDLCAINGQFVSIDGILIKNQLQAFSRIEYMASPMSLQANWCPLCYMVNTLQIAFGFPRPFLVPNLGWVEKKAKINCSSHLHLQTNPCSPCRHASMHHMAPYWCYICSEVRTLTRAVRWQLYALYYVTDGISDNINEMTNNQNNVK